MENITGRKRRTKEEVLLAKKALEEEKLKKKLLREQKIQETERKKQKKALEKEKKIAKKTQLIPDEIYKHLKEMWEKYQIKESTPLNGMMWFSKFKEGVYRVILINKKARLLLIKVSDTNTWRDELWFYSVDSKQYLRYSEVDHRKGYGDSNIVWPSLE